MATSDEAGPEKHDRDRLWLACPLHTAIRRAATEHPDQAWITFVGGPAFTYGELWDRILRVAGGLRRNGVTPGDRVVLVMDNSAEFVATWFAAMALGAVAVPVNCSARGRILEHYVGITEPVVGVVQQQYLARVRDALAVGGLHTRLVVVPDPDGTEPVAAPDVPFQQLVDGEPAELPEIDPADPAAIIFTSGTTGTSKGVTFSHRFLSSFAEQGSRIFGYRPDDVVFTCLPFFHANALVLVTCGSLFAGARVAVSPRFSVSRFWAEIASTGATVTSLLGSMASLLLQRTPDAAEREHRLERAMLVPAPAHYYDLLRDRFGIESIDIFGMTDVGMPVSNVAGGPFRPGSCGRVMDGFECILVDEDDEEVPLGEVGEALVRPTAPTRMSLGYWKMPEQTLEAWRGLWFRSGDLLRRDADGWYYFVDRVKDAIRRRGENISSYEVEQTFLDHPLVAEAAAYPISSDLTEDDVALAVVLEPGAEITPEDLLKYGEHQLPYFCLPRYVTFLSEMPKTPTQKIQKRALADMGVTVDTWDMETTGYRPSR